MLKNITWQNHFAIAKFKIPKGLKGKKNHKLPPFGKFTEVATRGVLWKKLLLEISQNLQETTVTESHVCNEIK